MPQSWKEIVNYAVDIRRQLHQQPELPWQEHQTCQKIRAILSDHQISWKGCTDTGTIATINQNAKGSHLALRADIDALPIVENTDVKWQSQAKGCMHACGHDGHTATLLATAIWLKNNESSLKGPVSFFFQPAEEGGHGAKKMVEQGALNNIDAIYGWHNWPALPYGHLACPNDAVMGGNGTFKITLTGKGGHASQPEACIDPVIGASAVTMALQQIVSRRIGPQFPAVVTVSSIDAKSSPTVIPEKSVIEGSTRAADKEVKEKINQLIKQISQDTAKAYGLKCEVEITEFYEPTINHTEHAQLMRNNWASLYGDSSCQHRLPLPIMGSEDFSYYLAEIPGAYALIGSDDGNSHDLPCHSSFYDFNDKLIDIVGRWFCLMVDAPVPE